jgi:hypothetical protein
MARKKRNSYSAMERVEGAISSINSKRKIFVGDVQAIHSVSCSPRSPDAVTTDICCRHYHTPQDSHTTLTW